MMMAHQYQHNHAPVPCFLKTCECRFRTRAQMHAHYREHHMSDSRPFHCAHDGTNFTKAEHCRTHMRTIARIDFVCNIGSCRTKFHDRSNVIRHIRTKHKELAGRARELADNIVNGAHNRFLVEHKLVATDLKIVRRPLKKNKCSVMELIPHRAGGKFSVPNGPRVLELLQMLDSAQNPQAELLRFLGDPMRDQQLVQKFDMNATLDQLSTMSSLLQTCANLRTSKTLDGDAMEVVPIAELEPVSDIEKNAPFQLRPSEVSRSQSSSSSHASLASLPSIVFDDTEMSDAAPSSTSSSSSSLSSSSSSSSSLQLQQLGHGGASPFSLKITLPNDPLDLPQSLGSLSNPKTEHNMFGNFGLLVGGLSPLPTMSPFSMMNMHNLTPRLSADCFASATATVGDSKSYGGLTNMLGLPISPMALVGMPVFPLSGLPRLPGSPLVSLSPFPGSSGKSNTTQTLNLNMPNQMIG